MLKALLNKQILELFQGYIIDKKSGKARTRTGLIRSLGLLAFLFLSLGLTFYSMANGLGIIILNQGYNWLYFALLGLMSIALGAFGSVLSSYASLYLPKDNETLLAMPIPPQTLVLARTAGVYVSGLMYCAWIWVPTLIAYWSLVPVSFSRIILPVLLTFVITLFVTVLSCLLGYFVAMAATRIKGKNFLIVGLSLLGIVIYYVGYAKVIGFLKDAVNHIEPLTAAVQTRMHYILWLGKAADGDWLSMLLFSGVTAALAILCLMILSNSFLKMATSGNNSAAEVKEPVHYPVSTPSSALFRRELLRFTSLPSWMLNGGFGLLIMLAGAAAAIIKREAILATLTEMSAEIPWIGTAQPVLLAAAFCLIISTNLLTPVSISIEGKSLWIVQSLPVDPWDVLRAKESLAIRLSVLPVILSLVIIGLVIRLSPMEIIACCISVLIYLMVNSDFGLVLGLKFPNLAWTNVMIPIKRGMALSFALLGGWGFCSIFGIAGTVLCRNIPAPAVLAGYSLLLLGLLCLIRFWLKGKGREAFRNL